MSDSTAVAGGGLAGFLGRLRFPQLFAVAAVVFAVDLVIPDLIPFVDEIFFGLLTAMFAAWKARSGVRSAAAREKNVTPAAEPLPRISEGN
jgi:Family of unknown function (DUF6116)